MSRHRKQDERDDALCREVFDALAVVGGVAPQTEADVAKAEEAMRETSIELPAELRDARRVFRSPVTGGETKSAGLPIQPEPGGALRRAAREGGRLTDDIEERMRQDRRQAEQEQDDHGQDSR